MSLSQRPRAVTPTLLAVLVVAGLTPGGARADLILKSASAQVDLYNSVLSPVDKTVFANTPSAFPAAASLTSSDPASYASGFVGLDFPGSVGYQLTTTAELGIHAPTGGSGNAFAEGVLRFTVTDPGTYILTVTESAQSLPFAAPFSNSDSDAAVSVRSLNVGSLAYLERESFNGVGNADVTQTFVLNLVTGDTYTLDMVMNLARNESDGPSPAGGSATATALLLPQGFSLSATPEPPSVALLGAGGVLLALATLWPRAHPRAAA